MHHIAIIHGIGKTRRGYAAPLSKGIKDAYRVLGGVTDDLVFHEIVWDDLVGIEQARLDNVLRKSFGLPEAGAPVGWLSKIFGGPKRMINNLRTDFAATYIGDILAYQDSAARQLIHERVDSVLHKIAASGEGTLSIIAHSLGTVIASDHIYDAQKSGNFLAGNIKLRNFFTLGSPIALFALKYGGAALFKSPARMEDPKGQWLNIFDKDDPIAYPLKALNDAYDQAVTRDVPVNTGLFGVAHTRYFKNKHVQRIIVEALRIPGTPA